MIRAPAPFPHAGSFALFADPLEVARPRVRFGQPEAPALNLVRIMALVSIGEVVADTITVARTQATISFPLRDGVASGARTVDLAELIDCTPLTKEEERSLADLQRYVKGRTRMTAKLRAMKEQADALEQRLRMATLAAPLLARLDCLRARPTRRAA